MSDIEQEEYEAIAENRLNADDSDGEDLDPATIAAFHGFKVNHVSKEEKETIAHLFDPEEMPELVDWINSARDDMKVGINNVLEAVQQRKEAESEIYTPPSALMYLEELESDIAVEKDRKIKENEQKQRPMTVQFASGNPKYEVFLKPNDLCKVWDVNYQGWVGAKVMNCGPDAEKENHLYYAPGFVAKFAQRNDHLLFSIIFGLRPKGGFGKVVSKLMSTIRNNPGVILKVETLLSQNAFLSRGAMLNILAAHGIEINKDNWDYLDAVIDMLKIECSKYNFRLQTLEYYQHALQEGFAREWKTSLCDYLHNWHFCDDYLEKFKFPDWTNVFKVCANNRLPFTPGESFRYPIGLEYKAMLPNRCYVRCVKLESSFDHLIKILNNMKITVDGGDFRELNVKVVGSCLVVLRPHNKKTETVHQDKELGAKGLFKYDFMTVKEREGKGRTFPGGKAEKVRIKKMDGSFREKFEKPEVALVRELLEEGIWLKKGTKRTPDFVNMHINLNNAETSLNFTWVVREEDIRLIKDNKGVLPDVRWDCSPQHDMEPYVDRVLFPIMRENDLIKIHNKEYYKSWMNIFYTRTIEAQKYAGLTTIPIDFNTAKVVSGRGWVDLPEVISTPNDEDMWSLDLINKMREDQKKEDLTNSEDLYETAIELTRRVKPDFDSEFLNNLAEEINLQGVIDPKQVQRIRERSDSDKTEGNLKDSD